MIAGELMYEVNVERCEQKSMGQGQSAHAKKEETIECVANNTSWTKNWNPCKMADLPSKCLKLFPRTASYEQYQANVNEAEVEVQQKAEVFPSIVAGLTVNNSTEELEEVDLQLPLTAYGCSFSPDNDCLLVTVSVFSHQVPGGGLLRMIPSAGFVIVWNVSTGEHSEKGHKETYVKYDVEACSGLIFTYSPKPCCKFAPDGETVSAILNSGGESITIIGREEEEDDDDEDEYPWFSEKRLKNLGRGGITLCGKTNCFVYSRFGNKVATVSNVTLATYRNHDIHELCVWEMKNNAIKSLSRVSCEVAYPAFRGQICDCKFSPDGTLIGVSSTVGQLLLFNSDPSGLWTVLPTHINDEDEPIFSPCHFDFNPTHGHSIIATAWRVGILSIWCCRNDTNEKVFTYKTETDIEIHSLRYSQDAIFLALGTSNGQVIVLSSDYGHCVYMLDAINVSNHWKIQPAVSDTTVYDISFSNSCQELCAAYGDGIIRFWQLPRILNLQHICRLRVLTLIPLNTVPSLQIPEKLKMYLLFLWESP